LVIMMLRTLVDRLERAEVLDRPGGVVLKAVTTVLRGKVRDVLHGGWLGHPLHPAMVTVPIGAWLSATVLDALQVRGRAPTILVGLGSAAAVPTAVAGLNDWSSLSREQRRMGLVHGATNTVALACYVSSFVARLRGNEAAGRRLAYAGMTVASAGAYLGGHLTYRQAASVSNAEPLLRRIPEGWHSLCDVEMLTPGKPQSYHIGEVPVLVTRANGDVSVMIEQCAHETGPLGEGDVVQLGGADCVVCPWHGSTYRLSDGAVVHGPAATNQPMLRSRIRAGRVEASLP
jgi:nitrite reductase/ring-hydroxylating ferredoxin subunit/uncharacterized membrane protein